MSTVAPEADGLPGYNFAYLDEQTRRMIRRALLKAVAIPGHQVPFAAREMPLPYGWGTGGIQITAALVGRSDVLKVIDQGADDATNATSIRRFFARTAGVATTEDTSQASLIQTRHRVPETPLRADQVLVYQVPDPEPLRKVEPRQAETRRLHAAGDYGLARLALYEQVARYGRVRQAYNHPVLVNRGYLASPSPIPRFDNGKLDDNSALQLFGAGRERRVYAIPPHTRVESLAFDDIAWDTDANDQACSQCGSTDTYLDEIVLDDAGTRAYQCSDTDYCGRQQWGGVGHG